MTVCSLNQASKCAVVIYLRSAKRADSRIGEELRSIRPRGRQCAKVWCLVPALARQRLTVVVECFVGEKTEEAIVYDRPADRATPIVEATFISHVSAIAMVFIIDATRRVAGIAVVFGKRIQSRAMCFEEKTAVVLIGAVLRDDLHLRAAVASVFCVVVVGDDLDFLNRVFIRGDDRSSTPSHAGRAHTVNLVVIVTGACTIGGNLTSILDFEDTVC